MLFSFTFQVIAGNLNMFNWIYENHTFELILCVDAYYKTKSFMIFQARYWRKVNFNTFQTRIIFSSLSRNLMLVALVKIVRQQIPLHLGFRSPRRNEHPLSTTLHATFNNAFNWGEHLKHLLLADERDNIAVDPNTLSFTLLINFVSITLSFAVLDVCPIIFF